MSVNKWLVYLLFFNCYAIATDRFPLHIQRRMTPVSLYGYRRCISSVVGVSYSLELDSSKNISCPTQLSLHVHKATLTKKYTADDYTNRPANYDCTEFMRSQCLGKRSCLISIEECKNKLHYNYKESLQLILQYSCEPATFPKALYNGSFFVEGVFRDFLLITGNNSSDNTNKNSMQLQNALRKCLEATNCQYVTCNDSKIHTDEYFDDSNVGICAYLKPSQFKLSGYAVYINYTGICNRAQQLKTKDFYEVAKIAKSQHNSSFSIAYQPISQFNISASHQAWICAGTPTILPMNGHIVAVPAVRA